MSCMPAQYDFMVYEGVDCKALQTTIGTSITGSTITFTAAESFDSTPLITITGVIDDGAAGKFHIPFTAADTEGKATTTPKKLVYDVFIEVAGQGKMSPIFGNFTIHPKVKATA